VGLSSFADFSRSEQMLGQFGNRFIASIRQELHRVLAQQRDDAPGRI
jgi:hypothetical protein